ncbi:MAG: hypothetical protein IKU33_04495 [Bacteroidales bacterium]|nr:hypothetical protein [Bacteroidales bacterium]
MKIKHLIIAAAALVFGAASCQEKEPQKEETLAPQIQLRKTEVTIASDGASVNIAYMIENDVEGRKISVANDADWLTVDTGKARVLTLSALVNETGAQRHTDVTISYEGAEDVVLSVTQEFFVSPLTISISKVTATGVTFSVTTSDESLTWIPMVTYKDGFEYYESADELFQYDLEYFAYLADIRDMTLSEFLGTMVASGSMVNVPFDGLQPSTDYVLYAYGITVDGRRTTDIVHEAFRTEDPYEGDIVFSFDASEDDYILSYTITPSHTGVPYFYGIAPKTRIDEWKSRYNGDLRAAIQAEEIDSEINELMDLGMISGPEDYFAIYSESNVMDWGYYELTASTSYVIYAVKWDEQCRLSGPVSTYEHTSSSIDASDNQITLEVANVTQSSADAVTTVTTEDPYVVMPIRTSELEGLTDEELFAYLVDKYDYIIGEYTYTGSMTKNYTRMRPDTEYTFLAFGYKAGVMTTSEMDKVNFRTLPAGNPEDCTFEFSCEPDVDCAFIEVTPSDKGQFYHWLVYPSYYTKEDAKNYIRLTIQHAYEGDFATFASWELSLGTDSATAWDLYPETEYKVGAVIMDYDTGEFLSDVYFSEPFTTLAKKYADLTFNMEYGPYYDLGELIRAGQTQFEPVLKNGDALMPIKVAVEGQCSAFYYALYANDLSDTETYPDEIFYAGLEGGGKSYSSTNLIVKYDTPMTLVAVAYDYENNATQLYRDVLFFTQDGASPAKDFIASMKKSASTMSVKQDAVSQEVMMPVKKYDEERSMIVDFQTEDLRRENMVRNAEEAKKLRSRLLPLL